MDYLEKATDGVKSRAAAFMLTIGVTSVARSIIPTWSYEPEMSQAMMDELMNEE